MALLLLNSTRQLKRKTIPNLPAYSSIIMALNFSGVDLQLYFNAITAGHVSIFTFVVLPPFMICILCILALVFTKGLIVKIRVLLINILTAEALNWFVFFIVYLGWPLRFITNEDISCKIYVSLFAIMAVLKFASTSIYGVGVYLFVRHGEKKLKWYVIIPYIVVTWTVTSMTLGVIPYIKEYGAIPIKGWCIVDSSSALFFVIAVSHVIGATFFVSIEVICCILTVVYIKRNTSEGNSRVKKATTKVLGYLAIISILSFINVVLPYVYLIATQFQTVPNRNAANLSSFLALSYLIKIIPNILAFPTPIITILLLKPLRDAIKTISKKACPCWPKNRVHPANTKENHATSNTGVSLDANIESSQTVGSPTATTDQSPTATDQGLPATDQGLAATDKGLDATDQGPATDKGLTATDQGLIATDKGLVTTDQGPATTDQGLVATDKGLTATDQGPATTDQCSATTKIDLNTNPDSTGTH